jgi:catechol 2,3-dioxygenase-like lactoylglutathione lyase family enzyme
MSATLHHIAIPARDAETTAAFLGHLLGVHVERDGAEDEFPCLRLANGVQILFQQTTSVAPHHIAFQVTIQEFRRVVDGLRTAAVAFGNDPDAPANGELTDPLGGAGRIYFLDRDGHLFEVCA